MEKLTDKAKRWATDQGLTEAEAFEYVIQRIKPDERIRALEQENADLRQELRVLAEQNRRLRETITRTQEEYYE